MIQEKDIAPLIEPKQVSFWPLQPRWYIIMGLVLIAAIYVAWKRYRVYLKSAYKREASYQVEALLNNKEFYFRLNTFLKSVAITTYGRAHTAQLSGEDWTFFLQKTSAKQTFSSMVLEAISQYHFKKPQERYAEDIFKASKIEAIQWIKTHEN